MVIEITNDKFEIILDYNFKQSIYSLLGVLYKFNIGKLFNEAYEKLDCNRIKECDEIENYDICLGILSSGHVANLSKIENLGSLQLYKDGYTTAIYHGDSLLMLKYILENNLNKFNITLSTKDSTVSLNIHSYMSSINSLYEYSTRHIITEPIIETYMQLMPVNMRMYSKDKALTYDGKYNKVELFLDKGIGKKDYIQSIQINNIIKQLYTLGYQDGEIFNLYELNGSFGNCKLKISDDRIARLFFN